MIKFHFNEKWKEIKFEEGTQLRYRYAVSNYGRVVSFKEKIEDGKLLSGATIQGYTVLNLKPAGKPLTLFVHKLVAEAFLVPEHEDQTYVIHSDYVKKNNFVGNLKWATRDEVFVHQRSNPAYKAANARPKYSKLSEADVVMIKKQLARRKTRIKLIAKQFGVTPMQINRIKRGENWAHVKLS